MNAGIRKLVATGVDKGGAIGGAIAVVIAGAIGGIVGGIAGAIGSGIAGDIVAIGSGIAGYIVDIVGIGGAIGGAIGGGIVGGIAGAIAILGILTTHPYRNLISGLPPEYEALIECESEEMDIKKPEDIVESVEDDLKYIEQKQRTEYELTEDGYDVLDCQELGQTLEAAGYIRHNQTNSDNRHNLINILLRLWQTLKHNQTDDDHSTFEITDEGQQKIERNDDLCEVLKDDLKYIEQKQKQEQVRVEEYELTECGYPVAIKSRQRIEKTNLNLYVIAVSALGIGFSSVVSMGSPIFALFIPVGVLLIILPLARSKAWTR